MNLERSEMLLGKDAISKLKQKKVAIYGIGGVGGFVVEALARTGIGNFVLIDNDTVSPSNINRQIVALSSTLGKAKTEIMKSRILDINPDAKVEIINEFYLPEVGDRLFISDADYIVDAIDTVSAKIDIIVRANEKEIPIISAMGAGNKLEPTRFEVSDIYKTSVCPLCRVMRRELKARDVKKLKVVYSQEMPIKSTLPDEPRVPGSVAFVPSVMGLIIAGEVIKDLCELTFV